MTIHPSLDASQVRLLRNFTGVGVPKGERVDSLNVEVLLPSDEARHRGVLRLGVPIFALCMMCSWYRAHTGCLVSSMYESGDDRAGGIVAVRVPPQVRHGAIIAIPLRGLELHNFYLRLHIAVTAWG